MFVARIANVQSADQEIDLLCLMVSGEPGGVVGDIGVHIGGTNILT
jgi:hypothetical protein